MRGSIATLLSCFTRSDVDPNLYFKVDNDKPLILVLYVDDLFLTSADPLIYQCKMEFDSKFDEGPRVDTLLPRLGGLAKAK